MLGSTRSVTYATNAIPLARPVTSPLSFVRHARRKSTSRLSFLTIVVSPLVTLGISVMISTKSANSANPLAKVAIPLSTSAPHASLAITYIEAHAVSSAQLTIS